MLILLLSEDEMSDLEKTRTNKLRAENLLILLWGDVWRSLISYTRHSILDLFRTMPLHFLPAENSNIHNYLTLLWYDAQRCQEHYFVTLCHYGPTLHPSYYFCLWCIVAREFELLILFNFII